MRVLIFAPMVRFGMQHYVQCVIREAELLGLDISLILPKHAQIHSECKPIFIGGGGKVAVAWANLNPLTYLKLTIAALRYRPDIVHVLNGEGRFTTLWLMILCRLLRLRTLISVHDPAPHPGANFDQFTYPLQKLSIRISQEIIIHDVAHLPFMRRYKKVIHVFTLPNIATLYEPQPRACREDAILFFGRIEPYKGIRAFIEVGLRLKSRAKFIIAGHGFIDEEALHIIRTNSDIFELHNRVVTDEDMIRFFDRAKIVLLPYESATQSGIPPLAASRGTIPIGFAVGGLANQIPKVGGLVVPYGDIDALTSVTVDALERSHEIKLTPEAATNEFSRGILSTYFSKSSSFCPADCA